MQEIFLFLFVLFYAIIYSLLCASLFPDTIDSNFKLKERYYKIRKWFFFLFALAMIVDYFDTYFKYTHGAPFPDLITYLPLTIGVLIGSIIGVITKNERFHAGFAIFFTIIILYQIYSNFLTID